MTNIMEVPVVTAQDPTTSLLDLVIVLDPGHPAPRQDHMAILAGRLGLAGVLAPAATSPQRLAALAVLAAPARVLGADEPVAHLIHGRDPAAVRAIATATGEPRPSIVVELSVAIGRTYNEAVARADRDPRFHGAAHPRESGLFGTFEQAQTQVLELARAGATQLRLVLADELDVADLMAQVRALVVGATPALLRRDCGV
jgi:hypothetical protein